MSLTAKVEDLTQTNAAAKAEIGRLTSIIKTLHRDRFGERSEKLGAVAAEQQCFEVETGLAALDARLAAKADSKPRTAPRDKPRFPTHLERVEEILEPEVPAEFQDKERAAERLARLLGKDARTTDVYSRSSWRSTSSEAMLT